jgi:hypothetical protein
VKYNTYFWVEKESRRWYRLRVKGQIEEILDKCSRIILRLIYVGRRMKKYSARMWSSSGRM